MAAPSIDDRNDRERAKAIDLAVGQIEKQFGKGSIMRLGQKDVIAQMPSISTGSVSLDYALGIGGMPRGRVREVGLVVGDPEDLAAGRADGAPARRAFARRDLVPIRGGAHEATSTRAGISMAVGLDCR